MRTGATQDPLDAEADVRATIGADVYTSQDGGRVLRVYADEQVWGGQYVIELDNSDEALNAKDYEGESLTLYFGFIGTTGSDMIPLYVHNQSFGSKEGVLTLILNCIDAWGLLAQVNADLGTAAYNQEWQKAAYLDTVLLPDGVTLLSTVTELYDAILANGDKVVLEVLDDLVGTIGKNAILSDDDGIINLRKPPVTVRSPIQGVRNLLEMTKCYLRINPADGDFYTDRPVVESPIYNFDVANLFFSNIEDEAVVIPNRVVFYAWNEAGSNWISGPADDEGSQGKIGIVQRNYLLADFDVDVRSTEAELEALAEGALDKIQGERSQGTLVAPMHCSLELFDRISITDSRYTTPRITNGHVHRLTRVYDRGVYAVTVQLGGVTGGYTPPGGNIPTPLADADVVPSVPESPPTYAPLKDQTMVVETTFASTAYNYVSWSGTNSISWSGGLTKTFDNGSRTMTNAIEFLYYTMDDATLNWGTDLSTILASEDNFILATFVRGATTNDRVRVDSWHGVSLISLDSIPNGSYFHRVINTALNSSGFVLLDQLIEETLYGRIAKDDLDSSHHVLIDTLIEGTYARVLATAVDASGYVLIDYIVDGTTYQRVKKAALSAEGFVLFDEVMDGTSYGKVAKAALTAAGLYLIDELYTTGETFGLVQQAALTVGGLVLISALDGSFDDLTDGTNFKKVAATYVDAGRITLERGIIYLVNGGFEFDGAVATGAANIITGWEKGTGTEDYIEVSTTASHSDIYGLEIHSHLTQATWVYSPYLPVYPDTVYEAQAWFKSSLATGAALTFRIYFYDEDKVFSDMSTESVPQSTTTWTKISNKGKSPSNARFARIRFYRGSGGSNHWYIDDVEFIDVGRNLHFGAVTGTRIDLETAGLFAYNATALSFGLFNEAVTRGGIAGSIGDAWFGGILKCASIETASGRDYDALVIDQDLSDDDQVDYSYNLTKGRVYTVWCEFANDVGSLDLETLLWAVDSANEMVATMTLPKMLEGANSYADLCITFHSGLTSGGTTPYTKMRIINRSGSTKHVHGHICVQRVV